MELIVVHSHLGLGLRDSQGVSELPHKAFVRRRKSVDVLVHGVTQGRRVYPAKTIKIFDSYTFIASRTAQDRAQPRTC
ncbi:hypothetical protein ACIQPT_08805 [Streptomyces sp. NPDC091289]|uniref:hypothetical protein n=1 Tax=Streptomyces sp. NPDC091289 TaxID=3365989 RepID=UPI0038118448